MSRPSQTGSLNSPRPSVHAPPDRHASLMRTIESQVIPRLMVLHAKNNPPERPVRIEDEQVTDFAHLVLDGDEAMVSAYVEALMLQGASLELIHLNLLAPTARKLGDMWCTDACSFADVTIGLGTLQKLIRELASDFSRVPIPGGTPRQALLLPVIGEQHSLGAQMLGEFFRQAGWEVYENRPDTEKDLATTVAEHWFDLVGLSLSGEGLLDALTRQVRLVRQNSLNRQVVVLVGGSLFDTYPDLTAFVGADGSANSARSALDEAEKLCRVVAT